MTDKNKTNEELYTKKIANRIRELRKEAGLIQEKVAEDAGIDYKFFQRVESGTRNITLKTLIKICNALNIKLKDFFDFDI